MSPRIAAFFDLDGTLIEGTLAAYLLRHLVKVGRVPARQVARAGALGLLYKLDLLTPEEIHRASSGWVVGWEAAEAERLMAEVFARDVRPRIYAGAAERVAWHREQGHALAIVTTSPESGARHVADVLGIPHVLGSRTPVVEGRISDGFRPEDLCFGPAKVTRVQAFAAEHGIDLAASWAYSDSRSDLPLLLAVGHAKAVNPQWLLERAARAEGIEVMRFRGFLPR